MFCAKCGAEMADDARKCDQCGAPVRVRSRKAAAAAKDGKKKLSGLSEANIPSQEDVEKSLREDAFMDPVFFKEAGGDVDVEAIIKIARGEEPGAAGEAGEEDDRPTAVISNPELDMAAYLDSLPLIEKVRRSFFASRHRREEAADARRMRLQLERASKHFEAEEAARQKAEAVRIEQARRQERALAAKAEAERTAAEEARRREEAALAAKAEAERAAAEEARRREEAALAAKAEAERAAAEEARRREEAALAAKAEAERPAAGEAPLENVQAVPEEEATVRLNEKAAADRIAAVEAARQREEELVSRHAQADRPEVIRLQNKGRAAAIRRQQEQEAAEAEEARIAAQQAAGLQGNTAGAEKPEAVHVQPAEPRGQQTAAETYQHQQTDTGRAEKFLNLGPADHTTYARLEERTHETLTPRERGIEELRRRRRHRANKPDRIDEFLSRYGLTKEMSVRIATLFLIAVLSVIYVLGRGGSGSASDTSYAGEGMTGSEITQDQGIDGTQTEPSQDSDQTELPTGGGDFQSN